MSRGEAGGYLRCRIVPSSCSFGVQTFVHAALKPRSFISEFSSPDVFEVTTSSTFEPKFSSFSGVTDIVPGPGTWLNSEDFLDKIFTEPGSACSSSTLYWGTIYNKGMGFFWEKTSRTKLIKHLIQNFGVDPPTAIALSQPAIVIPRPRTNRLSCLWNSCSSWGGDKLPSASRACYCILGWRQFK